MASCNSNIHQEGIEKREPTPLEKHVTRMELFTLGKLIKVSGKLEVPFFFPFLPPFSLILGSVKKLDLENGLLYILFPIEVKNIKFGKHGSDTDVYDSEGRFVEEKFEEIFKKHAHTNVNALTDQELDEMRKANGEPMDLTGRIAALAEWKILYYLYKDKHGLLGKEIIRGVYDGSLFDQMANDHQSKKKKVVSSS